MNYNLLKSNGFNIMEMGYDDKVKLLKSVDPDEEFGIEHDIVIRTCEFLCSDRKWTIVNNTILKMLSEHGDLYILNILDKSHIFIGDEKSIVVTGYYDDEGTRIEGYNCYVLNSKEYMLDEDN